MTYLLTPQDLVANLIKILSGTSFWASLNLKRLIIWPPECSQCFPLVGSSDLHFDPTRPIFELNRDFVKDIIVSKFEDIWDENVASRKFTGIFYYLIWWPTFLTPHVPVSNVTENSSRTSFWASLLLIRLKIRLLECSEVFLVTYFFDPTWPSFERDLEFVQDIILRKFEFE